MSVRVRERAHVRMYLYMQAPVCMYGCIYIPTYTNRTIPTTGVRLRIKKFITGQNEREESTQNTTVTKTATCASYKNLQER